MKTITINTEHGPTQYVPVHERIKWLKNNGVDYEIRTEIQWSDDNVTPKLFIAKATLVIHTEGGPREYTGTALEVVSDDGVNSISALENAETSAVGRAIAFYGVGIDNGIASADEMEKVDNTPEKVIKSIQNIKSVDEMHEYIAKLKKNTNLYNAMAVKMAIKRRVEEITITNAKR